MYFHVYEHRQLFLINKNDYFYKILFLKSVSVFDSFYATILLELVVPASKPIFSVLISYELSEDFEIDSFSLIPDKIFIFDFEGTLLPGFSHGHSMSASLVDFFLLFLNISPSISVLV